MNGLNSKLIEECLKDHICSSDDDGDSDSSSNYRTELDDDYYANTEKPIPLDKVKLNLISPSEYQQWEINQNPCRRENPAKVFENVTPSRGTVVHYNSKLPDLVNTTAKGIKIVDVDIIRKHDKNKIVVDTLTRTKKKKINNGKQVSDTKSNDSCKHGDSIIADKYVLSKFGGGYKPMEKNLAAKDIRKIETQKINSQQPSSSKPFGNNMHNYLLNNEDGMIEAHLISSAHLKQNEAGVKREKESCKKNKIKNETDGSSLNPNNLKPTTPNVGSATLHRTSGSGAIPRIGKYIELEDYYSDFNRREWLRKDFEIQYQITLEKSKRKQCTNLYIPPTIMNLKSLSIGDDLYFGVSYIISNFPKKRHRYPLSIFYLIGTVLRVL